MRYETDHYKKRGSISAGKLYGGGSIAAAIASVCNPEGTAVGN